MLLDRYAVIAAEKYTILEPSLEPLENRLYGLLVDAISAWGYNLGPPRAYGFEDA